MSRLSELQEKRNSLVGHIREIAKHADDNGLPSEYQEAWRAANKDYDDTMAEMQRIRAAEQVTGRLKDLEADDNEVVNRLPRQSSAGRQLATSDSLLRGLTHAQRGALAMQGWCRNAYHLPATERQLEAMTEFGVRENQAFLDLGGMDTGQYRNMQSYWQTYHPSIAPARYQAATMTTTGSARADGGFSMPLEIFLQRMEINMLAYGGVRPVAEMIVTESGVPLTWPTVDDTAQSAVQITEGGSRDASGAGTTNPTFAQVIWNAYMFNSGTALITDELMEDSAFNLGDLIADLLSERLWRGTNIAYTTGTGSGQPHGIAVAATTGVTAASATVLIPDELIKLVHSVDPAYRGRGTTGFMAHDSTILAWRLFKESTTNAYMWQPGMQAGIPDRLLGYPVYFNQHMDGVLATGDTAVLFGNLAAYKIRRVRGVRFYRLDELYRATGKTGFVVLVREDGKLLTAGTPQVKKLVMA